MRPAEVQVVIAPLKSQYILELRRPGDKRFMIVDKIDG